MVSWGYVLYLPCQTKSFMYNIYMSSMPDTAFQFRIYSRVVDHGVGVVRICWLQTKQAVLDISVHKTITYDDLKWLTIP